MASQDHTNRIVIETPQVARPAPPTASETVLLETVERPRRDVVLPIVLAIVAVGFFLNVFRTMEAIDINGDEGTYAIESVALGRTGMTQWNGSAFLVHPPLFFGIESLVYRVADVGNGPLFDRLLAKNYVAGEALMLPDAQLTGDTMPRAIFFGRILNAIIGALLAAMVFIFGRLILNWRLGVFAAAVFLLDPYIVWRNHFNYLEPLATLLGLAAVYFYYKADGEQTGRRRRNALIAAGIGLGLALLTKELALLYAAAMVTHWLFFKRRRSLDVVLPIAVGGLIYSFFPVWAAVNGEFDTWWTTKTWLFNRATGTINDSGIARPGSSLLSTIAINLPDYWPWFLLLAVAPVLAVFFLYQHWRHGLRDRAAEFLSAAIIGTYAFFVLVRLLGGVINEQYFYFLMPFVVVGVVYAAMAWRRLAARAQAGPGEPGATAAPYSAVDTGEHYTVPRGRAYDPEMVTVRNRAFPAGNARRASLPGRILFGFLILLTAYNLVAWVVRYGFSRDNSFISLDAPLADRLQPGEQVVGRDILDLYLLPKQRVLTFSYLNLVGNFIDPANIEERRIPYAILNDQSLQQRYGGANPAYYEWVRANGRPIERFEGRVYGTYAYQIDYTAEGRTYGADSMAVGKPVTASSTENFTAFPPENAFDARLTTRWASHETDNEWIQVDLGQPTSIGRIELTWEEAYARSYELQVSDDGQNWTTFYKTDQGAGQLEKITSSARGRYLRLLMTKRATPFGYSLWEISVYP